MGRIKQTSLLADYSGAVGNVVVTKWRDQGVIKKKGVRSNKVWSVKQGFHNYSQILRKAFGILSLSLRQFFGSFPNNP